MVRPYLVSPRQTAMICPRSRKAGVSGDKRMTIDDIA
jgi:hypothetical protein